MNGVRKNEDPGTESTRQRNGRPTDARAPKARLHRVRRTLGGTPIEPLLQHPALRERRSHLPSVGRPFLCRVFSTPGSARAPKALASCPNPGTESTRLLNGRPTDARAPKALASCPKPGIENTRRCESAEGICRP